MAFKPQIIEGGIDAPFWRDNPEFRPNILFKAKNWWVYLAPAPQQAYLGRAYIWLTTRHVTSQQLYDLNYDERGELFDLMRLYDRTIKSLWPTLGLNYHWDGNEIQKHDGHGHMHLIPRYDAPIDFEGHEFRDERLGKSHSPYTKANLPEQVYPALHVRLCQQINYLAKHE